MLAARCTGLNNNQDKQAKGEGGGVYKSRGKVVSGGIQSNSQGCRQHFKPNSGGVINPTSCTCLGRYGLLLREGIKQTKPFRGLVPYQGGGSTPLPLKLGKKLIFFLLTIKITSRYTYVLFHSKQMGSKSCFEYFPHLNNLFLFHLYSNEFEAEKPRFGYGYGHYDTG